MFYSGFLFLSALCVFQASGDGQYSNEFAVKVLGGPENADKVARDLGYENLGQIGALDDYYLLAHKDVPARSRRSAHTHVKRLVDHPQVHWAEQQQSKSRVKRGYIPRNIKEDDPPHIEPFHDPNWSHEWYLTHQDSDKRRNPTSHADLRVVEAWDKYKVTGKGVVISIPDDGLEWTHPDLRASYDPYASTDLNGGDSDPSPRYDALDQNRHGTRCAGEIAMQPNDNLCGVGVAYGAKVGGIRMLDGRVTDSVEAKALSFNHTYVDIVSASWGPNDDGKTLEGPGRLCKEAFIKGITEGRGGKGIIYMWASGNGGRSQDNCNCDGYTGSIYTLSISSATEHNKEPWYAERCASTMATAYSSGNFGEKKIVSTDLHNKCTEAHTGTSASAPLAAGVMALVLERNPNLTWRDVQHLVAWTSQKSPLGENPGWKTNGAGFEVSSSFGFGILDALALVETADPATWKTVPEKSICEVDVTDGLPKALSSGNQVVIKIKTTGCEGQDNEIRSLEHVQLVVDVTYSRRGSLEIWLKAPSGMTTKLLSTRKYDTSRDGLKNWSFLSVHNWGENPKGTWEVTIADQTTGGQRGSVKSVKLLLHGTKEIPDHIQKAGGKKAPQDPKNKDEPTTPIPPIPSEVKQNNKVTGEWEAPTTRSSLLNDLLSNLFGDDGDDDASETWWWKKDETDSNSY
ncbi:neuroendocrine convertase 1 [Lingula anatina]|uniref:Neuroendocrine convertase 1 n=1 Tax=Lingula anatina TaxID=7574 RepID=A0A1S3JGN3_LINAN|nr:neuroendocrine convertase 1 [Lingula anatina]|eukprot:XP_013409557.1 neuroendocrine convertase 1 [Lingula anatina]